jgi:hypothetical protein
MPLILRYWGLDVTKFWIPLTDGHPDARGHCIMGKAFATFLAPLIRKHRATSVPRRSS